MSDRIFGYTWEQIQAAQQGKPFREYVKGTPSKKPATDEDFRLLKEHGMDGLKKMGFYGVLDRLNTSAEITRKVQNTTFKVGDKVKDPYGVVREVLVVHSSGLKLSGLPNDYVHPSKVTKVQNVSLREQLARLAEKAGDKQYAADVRSGKVPSSGLKDRIAFYTSSSRKQNTHFQNGVDRATLEIESRMKK